jgi:hypothetical protein
MLMVGGCSFASSTWQHSELSRMKKNMNEEKKIVSD